MPAMALVPSLDSVAFSVAAAAVALLVALLRELLLDADVLVAIEVVAEIEDVTTELPIGESLDGAVVGIEPLVVVEEPVAVSSVDEGSLNDEAEEVKVVKGVVRSLSEVSRI